MPIALLPDLAKSLSRVGTRLEPWERLVALEVEILRRARGAFLVQWFGRRVPERQLSLHVVFVNIAALKARYRLARQSLPQPYPELNLIGPIAGAAGGVAGLFASVSGSFLFAPHLHEVFEKMTGDKVDKFECAAIIAKEAFEKLFHSWLVWNVTDPNTCSILQVIPENQRT